MRTSASGWVRSLWHLAQTQGLDAAALFRQLELDSAQLDNPLHRYPQDRITQLWHELVLRTGNPGIGLEFGRHVTPATFSAVGYAMLSSSTLRDGIETAIRYQRYLGEALQCELTRQGDHYRLLLDSRGDRGGIRVQTIEAMLSAFIHFARWVMQRPVVPSKLLLRHAPTVALGDYQALFGCPVESEAAFTGFLLAPEWLHMPLPNHDPAMRDHHVRLADNLAQHSFKTFTHQVKSLLMELLPTGAVMQTQIADYFHCTPKTLQRRLEAEGSKFSALLEECRFEAACQYLLQPHVSLTEVAELSGYADYTAFAKAFRKWAGVTPKVWRQTNPKT